MIIWVISHIWPPLKKRKRITQYTQIIWQRVNGSRRKGNAKKEEACTVVLKPNSDIALMKMLLCYWIEKERISITSGFRPPRRWSIIRAHWAFLGPFLTHPILSDHFYKKKSNWWVANNQVLFFFINKKKLFKNFFLRSLLPLKRILFYLATHWTEKDILRFSCFHYAKPCPKKWPRLKIFITPPI
jgi:hypothetical protein